MTSHSTTSMHCPVAATTFAVHRFAMETSHATMSVHWTVH
jgi:hypothetical protein